jgi:hypothetical protein
VAVSLIPEDGRMETTNTINIESSLTPIDDYKPDTHLTGSESHTAQARHERLDITPMQHLKSIIV